MITLILLKKKSCQFFYKKYLSMYSEHPKKQQLKWNDDMNMEIDNWDMLYQIPFQCTKSNTFIVFQYKIAHKYYAQTPFYINVN